MTIKAFADLVRLRLNINSQDAPVQVDERVIIALADKAMSGLLPKYIQAFGLDVMGVMAIRQYFDVKTDADANLKYSDTEGRINAVAGNLGMIGVGLVWDDEAEFMITTSNSIYAGLEAGGYQGTKAWMEGGRIYYKNLPFSVTQVVVRAIPNMLSMELDASIPMPADLQDAVIDKIVAGIQGNKSEDKPNDNNDNKQTVSG